MSAAAIKAGNAWVELALKDKTDTGLANVKRKFLRWGMSLAAVGSAITAAAGGILAALTGAAKVFADTGSEIYDLSKATGVGAEELSALGYAAEQSGASMADVAASFKAVGKLTAGVAAGNKSAAATLQKLGIAAQDFLAASPYQRILLIADALQKIEDPSLRSALRVEALGRSAGNLGALLANGADGVRELVAEAERLGLVMSQAEADKADALGDAWGAVGKQFKQIAVVIGAAVAPALTDLLKALQPILAGVIEFVRNNPGLIKGLAVAGVVVGALGGALVVVGTVLAGIGLAIAAIPAIVAGFTAAVAAAGAVLGAILSPIGLIVTSLGVLAATLIGLGAYWLAFDQNVQAVLGGVWDAIAKGNWQLAGQIMMAALNVAWKGGIFTLQKLWEDYRVWFVSLMADMFGQALAAFATFEAALLAGINKLRGKLQLDPIAGTGLGEAGMKFAGEMKQTAQDQRNANLAGPQARLVAATAELAQLIAQANQARKQAGPKTPAAVSAFVPSEAAAVTSSGAAAGTFNAAIAGMLGSSAPSIADKQLKAAEHGNGLLERIEENTRDLNLEDAE